MQLSSEQQTEWDSFGWVVLRGVLDADRLAQIEAWTDELEEWSRVGAPALHHFEQTESGPALARTEKFADHHVGLNDLVRRGVIAEVLDVLFGEPAVLFKEKINYKQPGGAGFAPHQDATAYRFVDHHISVMVPLDPSVEASGCLYFAPGFEVGSMPTDDRGRVEESFAATLDWRPVEVQPGDLVFFDSYAPHQSGTNTSSRPRRAYYLTYNAASAGDFRSIYYADKEAEFAREGGSFGGERVRISISDDFLGRPVEVDR